MEEMNHAPRRTLRELIAKHGSGLCSDARRCEGLLRDLCGGHRREINILVGALRERVPLDLLAGRNAVPTGLLLTRLSRRLEEHLALTQEASRWAVDSWALALGVVNDAELAKIERERGGAAAARAEAPTTAKPAATRPTLEVGAKPPEAATRPAAPPARSPQGPRQGTTQPSPAQSPASPRATAPPATRGGSAAAARPPSASPPALPQTVDAGRLRAPANDPVRRGQRWRGCLVGCVLLLLLSVLLLAGTPYVINLLREEQRGSPEPAPAQTR